MNIINILKNYNNIKAKISIITSEIERLNKLLEIEDLSEYTYQSKNESAKPTVHRPTENKAIYSNENSKITHLEIKKEIQQLKIKLLTLQQQKTSIDFSFEALKREQQYILECKYFYYMTYENILLNLQSNKEFKNKLIWTKQTIINHHKRAIKVIESILDYRKFEIRESIFNNI